MVLILLYFFSDGGSGEEPNLIYVIMFTPLCKPERYLELFRNVDGRSLRISLRATFSLNPIVKGIHIDEYTCLWRI
jgi:hypothetical protein